MATRRFRKKDRVLKYANELRLAMKWLGEQPNTYFMGQAVTYPGTAMYNTLQDVPISKRLELPVCEVMQTGMATGMAVNGFVPISIYPRWNFLLLGTDQLVNHLDKLKTMSQGEFNPKVIIRTSIGSQRPLHPQHQHVGDFTDVFKTMCTNINIVRLDEPEQIVEEYVKAYYADKSTILVEWGDYYGEK